MVWKPAIAALAAAGVVLYSVAFMQVDLSNRLASWVQAIGSIAAIYGAYAIGRQQRESDKQIAQDLAAEEARNLLQVVKAIADDVFSTDIGRTPGVRLADGSAINDRCTLPVAGYALRRADLPCCRPASRSSACV